MPSRARDRQRLRDRPHRVADPGAATSTSTSSRTRTATAIADTASRSGSSAQGTTTTSRPPSARTRRASYVARVVNFAAVDPYDLKVAFRRPTFNPAPRENWRCHAGPSPARCWRRATSSWRAASGRTSILAACAAALQPGIRVRRGPPTGRPGARAAAGSTGCSARRRPRRRTCTAYKIGRKQTRKGIDRFCLSDGPGVRVGYATSRLNATRAAGGHPASRPTRRCWRAPPAEPSGACGIRVGSSSFAVRRRVGGIPIRIGPNRWYLKRGKRSTLVFKVRGQAA